MTHGFVYQKCLTVSGLSVCRWAVYQPDSDSGDGFSASHLQHFLSNFLDGEWAVVPKPRLLLLTPG